ncbi:uncharacterized protein LOC130973244 isoform X2 [Arachis stenosperma]|uniref:uncharacterized protein LOC130973244 isoform X2 n=1 Tax=Arachis stenosperma TaxID=217475 RepID=UPI0025AC0B9B|nr:uncharacterized protein LOC130973244 isoform X2 [Arachis stenosperma]
MREEEPSPNASPPLEELCSSSPPRRGKRSCSLASHRRASWLPMREPREPLPSREGGRARGSPQKSKFYRFDKEGNRWKERTYGTVKFPKNKNFSQELQKLEEYCMNQKSIDSMGSCETFWSWSWSWCSSQPYQALCTI